MKRLLIATTNRGKFKEFEDILTGTFLCWPLPKETVEAVEDGNSYRENAEKKARFYFGIFQEPVLADDTGLEVMGLDGKPGVHSARFAGPIVNWSERWKFLLEQLGSKDRTATFRCVLCYFDGKAPEFFEGIAEGYITSAPEGTEGFGYDPIFFSKDLEKTFGHASPAEKNQVSHRARAIRKFLDWYKLNHS